MNILEDWAFAGKNRKFFKEHYKAIHEYNSKMIGSVSGIMAITVFCFLAADVSRDTLLPLNYVYLAFFVLFAIFSLMYRYLIRDNIANCRLIILVLMESVFLLLLLVGPILDPYNLACFVPVFLVVCGLLFIVPMHYLSAILVVDTIIFIVTAYANKDMALAAMDTVDAIACMMVGIGLSSNVLAGRLAQIDSYDKLRKNSESELARALSIANSDPLTGVRSRSAYERDESFADTKIKAGVCEPFGIVVCDVNGLKVVNDSQGHAAGDQLLVDCSKVICNVFEHSPVYRIGGDEFLAFLQGDDCAAAENLLSELRKDLRIASGLSLFDPAEDPSVNDVFIRADTLMYQHKALVKAQLKEKSLQ